MGHENFCMLRNGMIQTPDKTVQHNTWLQTTHKTKGLAMLRTMRNQFVQNERK